MLRHFTEVIERAKRNGPVRLVVAAAQDEEALRAVKAAHDAGLAEAVLVGDSALIAALLPMACALLAKRGAFAAATTTTRVRGWRARPAGAPVPMRRRPTVSRRCRSSSARSSLPTSWVRRR